MTSLLDHLRTEGRGHPVNFTDLAADIRCMGHTDFPRTVSELRQQLDALAEKKLAVCELDGDGERWRIVPERLPVAPRREALLF